MHFQGPKATCGHSVGPAGPRTARAYSCCVHVATFNVFSIILPCLRSPIESIMVKDSAVGLELGGKGVCVFVRIRHTMNIVICSCI